MSEKNFEIEPMILSVSPCLLKPVSHYDEQILKELIHKIKKVGKNNIKKVQLMMKISLIVVTERRYLKLLRSLRSRFHA